MTGRITVASIWAVFREASRFFVKEGRVFETLRALTRRLDEAGIDHAVIGGMALAAHGYRRLTEDVEILVRPTALAELRDVLSGFVVADSPKTFRDTRTGVKIEIMTAGEYPGDGKPKRVVFPDPIDARVDKDELWVIALPKLVELKLASGLSAAHRLKDLADVQELILRLRLPLALGSDLDESVRSEYERLWRAAQQAPDEER